MAWRRWRYGWLSRAAALVIWSVGGSATHAQQIYDEPFGKVASAKRAVLVGKDAYVVLPPEPVSGPGKTRTVWPSPDGAYLLIARTALPMPTSQDIIQPPEDKWPPERLETTLTLWEVTHRRSTLLWRGSTTPTQFSGTQIIGWLPTTSLALGQIINTPRTGDNKADEQNVQTRLVLFDAARGAMRTLADIAPGTDVRICPTQPKAVLISPDHETLQLVRADGTLGRMVSALPKSVYWYGWRKDGQTLYGAINGSFTSAGDPPPSVPKTVLVDTEIGRVTQQDGQPPGSWAHPQYEPPHFPLPLETTFGKEESGDGETRYPLWLSGVGEDVQGRVLLSLDAQKPFPIPQAENPLILPGAVVYQAQGTLFAAPLIRTNRQAFIAARRETFQQLTLTRARQIQAAIETYTRDNKELPPPATIADALARYLSDKDALNNPETDRVGLQLVYKQQSVASYQSSNTIVLGYLAGPGGRVVLYWGKEPQWETKP